MPPQTALRILVRFLETQTPTLVVWIATLLLAAPRLLVALEAPVVDAVESVSPIFDVKGLTIVGVAITLDTDGSMGVETIVKDGRVGASELGVSITLPVIEASLVESILVTGPGEPVSRLWPGVVTGPVRVGRIVVEGRAAVLRLAEGRTSILAFAQS